MKLYIAEKPDIGKTIANFIWPQKNYIKEHGYFHDETNNIAVTWAVGHILHLAEPEEYGPEYNSWSNYPIFPKKWKLKPSPATKDQLKIIKTLLKNTETVIHAGDPDREGQLLIDEILQYLGYKNSVQRIFINAKDNDSMQHAFDNITDNTKYENIYYAGLGREQADWLVGMNLSRAYTVNARKYGYTNTFRIGRVKIPTLALVVNREKSIKDFKSSSYYQLKGTFVKDNITFTAMLQPSNDIPLDCDNHIASKSILEDIKSNLSAENTTIIDVTEKNMQQSPPLPHSLDTLQVEANKQYGFSPKEVLEIVQALYESKFVSYPRSDCNYIPMSQKDDAIKIIPMLTTLNILGADTANIAITSKGFNTEKVTAHHAIIPTSVSPTFKTDKEKQIYELIAQRYVLQFYNPYKFKKTSFTILSSIYNIFTGSGNTPIDLGFKILNSDKSTDDNTQLPALSINDTVDNATFEILDKKTTPPKRFTEGTLLAAMANIWKFTDNDNPNRKKLKEVKGIGTPATRDNIIAELQVNKLKGHSIEPCIKKVKNELIPTKFGTSLINNLDSSFIVPDTTAEMEYSLSEIEAGKKTLSEYIDEVCTMIYKNIQHAENNKFSLPPGQELIQCPICKSGHLIKKYSKKTGKFFHLCDNPNCVEPITNKPFFFNDYDGKPLIEFCPTCNNLLIQLKGKKGNFWLCKKCNKTYADKNNKPIFNKG